MRRHIEFGLMLAMTTWLGVTAGWALIVLVQPS